MKKLSTLVFIVVIIFINFIGCTTVNQTLYLQNIEVSGPMNNPPLNITTDQKQGSFTISPRISINDNRQLSGRIEKHSFVDNLGIYRIDTSFNNGTRYYQESIRNTNEYKGKNLIWKLPSFLAAVNIDYSAGNHIALNLGLSYSVQNQDSHVGGNAGIGFFSEKEGSAFRFDAGVMWQSLSYVASTVVITQESSFWGSSTNTTVNFYKDKNKSTNWNPYVSLTFNTSSKTAPLNFFLSLGYFGQTLFSFEPSDPNPEYYPLGFNVITSDQRGESTTTFLNLCSGVFIDMTENSKIILGVRLLKETQIEESSKSLFVLPVLQFDMGF